MVFRKTTEHSIFRVLYSTASDPQPQMIPKVDRKWSRKKNRNGLDSS